MDPRSAHAWQSMYPPLACHDSGWLAVGDGHRVYWETSGNPLGLPALFVHGGPGAGCSADDRRWFNPQRHRIVLFDQRGAGRSLPQAAIGANRSAHLIADMEALREHLQIGQWLLMGGSWGATLALAYAQQHPQRVRALVLRGVFTATLREQRWLYSPDGAARSHQAAWLRLHDALAQPGQAAAIDAPAQRWLAALAAQLDAPDPDRALRAASAWLQWERALMEPGTPACGAPEAGALAAARIGVHYARNAFFLQERALLRNAQRMAHIPGAIVHGEADRVTPVAAAIELHDAWPGSSLQRIAQAGHASSHPEMARALIAAVDTLGAGPI